MRNKFLDTPKYTALHRYAPMLLFINRVAEKTLLNGIARCEFGGQAHPWKTFFSCPHPNEFKPIIGLV